jgi:dienelactone hydrolase
MTPIVHEQVVQLELDDATLEGSVLVPPGARGLVIFAHGSGSSRHSPRNRYVADILHRHEFATLLFDLLTQEEEKVDEITRHLRFNIPLLARRLAGATVWARRNQELAALPAGYFGASTGAAASLVAAGAEPWNVRAVVSRGGRPDLAGDWLQKVRTPTLLIVGGKDDFVIDFNRAAYQNLYVDKKFEVIPGATHLFEEPGALERAAELAAGWFERWLPQ